MRPKKYKTPKRSLSSNHVSLIVEIGIQIGREIPGTGIFKLTGRAIPSSWKLKLDKFKVEIMLTFNYD